MNRHAHYPNNQPEPTNGSIQQSKAWSTHAMQSLHLLGGLEAAAAGAAGAAAALDPGGFTFSVYFVILNPRRASPRMRGGNQSFTCRVMDSDDLLICKLTCLEDCQRYDLSARSPMAAFESERVCCLSNHD